MGNHDSGVYECTPDDSTSDGDCIEQNIENGQGVEDDCDNQGKQKTGDVASAITITMTGTWAIVAAVSLTVLPTTTRAMTTMLLFEISATIGYSNPNAAAKRTSLGSDGCRIVHSMVSNNSYTASKNCLGINKATCHIPLEVVEAM